MNREAACPVKVLFVCTGNICRSPTAHGLMRNRVAQAGLGGRILVDSAGTHGYHSGEPPDRRAIATARTHGVALADLRARMVRQSDFAEFDIIAVMERSHERALQRLCPPALRPRISLLLRFAPGVAIEEVPDPYYDDDGFEAVFRMIESGVEGLLEHIRRTYPHPTLPHQGGGFG